MSIFVQIVSYKNFDLVNTVLDCISKSKTDLIFGICVQDDNVPVELNKSNINCVKIDKKLGHSYARNVAQSLYNNEDYVLQIEDGCRFAENWDVELLSLIKDKTIITNPANKFNPRTQEMEYSKVAYKAQVNSFLSNTPNFWSIALKNVNSTQKARNISDHFFFAPGVHCKECKHDPELYYSEIEASMTLKSFTLGYEILHHYKSLVFRNYERRIMNWNEDPNWSLKDVISKSKFKESLKEMKTKEFELYSGIDYENQRLQKSALNGIEPPCSFDNEKKWEIEFLKDYSTLISWDASKIEDCNDCSHWTCLVYDQKENVVARTDFRQTQDKLIMEKKISYKKLNFKSKSGIYCSKISIQPFSRTKGALNKVEFFL